MTKVLNVLVLIVLLFSISSCKNKKADFIVEKAYYYESITETKSFYNNGTINFSDLKNDYVILMTDFNYEVKSSNLNDLPKVKVGMVSVTYIVKLNGKELFSTYVNDDTMISNATYKEESNDTFVISSNNNIKVPITEKGTYIVTLYANYYLNNKRLAEPIEFKFKVN